MSLSNTQQEFSQKIAHLILHAADLGYGLTFGDAFRDARVHGGWGEKKSYSAANSVHKQRLAVDFNIFQNGKYLQGEEADAAHRELHTWWLTVGGAPGIENDLNHYSIEFQGHI